MKILYYHQHFSTPQGAIGTRSYEMAKKLVEHGHTVTMICGSYGHGATGLDMPFVKGRRQGEVEGVRVIEFELPYQNSDRVIARGLTFLRFAIRSTWIALFESYDVVVATSTPLTAAIPGVFARVLRRKPFVFEVRDLWPELPRAMGVITNSVALRLLDWLEWLAYRCATVCIGLSPGIVDGIKRRAGSHKRVTLIPNGCDLDLFAAHPDDDVPFPNLNKSDFVAVFTGAHGLANGLDSLLDVAAELRARRRSDIKLVLIGDGNCKRDLQARASKEELDQVIFLDPVPKVVLAKILVAADLGLMILADVPAFYYGTSPNKFFDYLAIGLPVLNNYPGWLADMIAEENIGIAVAPGDPEMFADALEQLADNPELRRQMSRNANGLAKAKFDRDKLSDAFVNEIEVAARS